MLAADGQRQTFRNQFDHDGNTNARHKSHLTDLCGYVDQCKLSRVIQDERHDGMILLYTATSNIIIIIIIITKYIYIIIIINKVPIKVTLNKVIAGALYMVICS